MKLSFLEVPSHAFGIDLGLTFVCLSDGRIVFDKNPMFVPTFDYSKEGVTACFDADGFSLMDKDGPMEPYEWGEAYHYKDIPTMLKWLTQQDMKLD